MDERMLVVHVSGLGLIVFSACSHAGIVNVCTEVRNLFPEIPIYCVMGGLHLGGVMEGDHPDTVEACGRSRSPHHYRPLHRLARPACVGQRLRRAVSQSAVGTTYTFAADGRHPARRGTAVISGLPSSPCRGAVRSLVLPVTIITGFLGSGKTTLLTIFWPTSTG